METFNTTVASVSNTSWEERVETAARRGRFHPDVDPRNWELELPTLTTVVLWMPEGPATPSPPATERYFSPMVSRRMSFSCDRPSSAPTGRSKTRVTDEPCRMALPRWYLTLAVGI